jgi:outer membrane protein OmpA-like peptidoglycan-associated protein
MKKIILILALAVGIAAQAQGISPVFEFSAGSALKHSEGFAVPRINLAAHKLYKGIGLYTMYEQRNNVTFADDFNKDGNYQRYVVGPTFSVNRFVYLFAGISPVGPYGLGGEGGFGKVRKEIGIAGVWKNYTMHFGYSNWVGTTVAVGYQFGLKLPKKPSLPKAPIQAPAPKVEEPVKEAPKPVEPPVEVAPAPVVEKEEPKKVEEPVLLAVVRFGFNSSELTIESSKKLDELVTVYKERYPTKELMIVGHTDPKGSDEVNYRIGLDRANEVATYLEKNYGIKIVKIQIKSEGESKIISPSNAINRRSEVYVIL